MKTETVSTIPSDGKMLILGDTYLYKMDKHTKGSQRNFDNLLDILDKKEEGVNTPFDFYIYKLVAICNQYGIDQQRAFELIYEKFKDHRLVQEKYFIRTNFKPRLLFLLKDAYARYAAVHDTYHKEIEDEGKEEPTPTLPDSVYQNLPPFLKKLTKHFATDREKDVFLLSSLGVLSSCFPEVRGCYDNNLVASNLFLFISAPASAGKGVMNWARRLGEQMHKDCESKYSLAMAEYEAAMKAFKEGNQDGQQQPLPVKPERQLFFIPANTSASKIIQTLKANGNFGVMFDTEADTLSQAIGKEWGGFSDTLRKCFHHESIELQRKMNDEYVSIEKSFLSVVLSGTPDQIRNLMASVENGFFSRFLFYDFPLSLNWKNVFDRSVEAPDGSFSSAATELLHLASNVSSKANDNGGHIMFQLSQEQENRFLEWFSAKQELLHQVFGDQIIASLRRLGLITYRIAMILSVIRCMKADIPHELHCADTDFDAALAISGALLPHTIKVYNQLKRYNSTKSASGRKSLYLDKLPDTFNRSTAMEIASLLGIKEKTAENYITGFINENLLNRVEHNHYQKL